MIDTARDQVLQRKHCRSRHARRCWKGILFFSLISPAATPGCSPRSHRESVPPPTAASSPLTRSASALAAPAAGVLTDGAAYGAPAASGLARIDVTSVGAVGDGVADDTAAIQRAIASLPPNGGTVFFPGGTYLIGQSQVIINRSQVRLEGAPGARLRGKPGAWQSAKLLKVQGTPEKHITDI